jgi:hypothetical protein
VKLAPFGVTTLNFGISCSDLVCRFLLSGLALCAGPLRLLREFKLDAYNRRLSQAGCLWVFASSASYYRAILTSC